MDGASHVVVRSAAIQFQDFGVTWSDIIGAGRIDEHDPLSVEDDLIRELGSGGG